MPSTSRFGLRSPAATDVPNVPQDIGFLAADVDGWLSRAFRCTSATRPSSPPDDFIVRETDTGDVLIWTGSVWEVIGGSGGGGGGAAVVGRWRASGAQTLSTSGTDYVVAFGTVDQASAVVTRSTQGAGHKFALGETSEYTIQAHVRFAAGTAGSRFLGLRNAAGTVEYWSDQGDGGPSAATRQFSYTDVFAAGSELVVVAAQASGGSLATVPTAVTPSGAPYVRLVIVQHG